MSLSNLFSNRIIVNRKLYKLLCETLVLSDFNFCYSLCGQCLIRSDVLRIQCIQNACMHFGIRKRQPIFHNLNWVGSDRFMADFKRFHSLHLYHKIFVSRRPARFKCLLSRSKHKTKLFKI